MTEVLPDGFERKSHHVDGYNPYTYRSVRYNRGGRGLIGAQLMTGHGRTSVRLWWRRRSVEWTLVL